MTGRGHSLRADPKAWTGEQRTLDSKVPLMVRFGPVGGGGPCLTPSLPPVWFEAAGKAAGSSLWRQGPQLGFVGWHLHEQDPCPPQGWA